MKKLSILLFVLTLCNMASWGKTVVTTVWEEDFQKQRMNEDFSDYFDNFVDYPGTNASHITPNVDGPLAFIALVVPTMGNTYVGGDFKYDHEEITDNWTLEFSYISLSSNDNNIYGESVSPYFHGCVDQFAIRGEKAEMRSDVVGVNSGNYFSMNMVSCDDNYQTGKYDLYLGDNKIETQLDVIYGSSYRFRLECKYIDETTAQLHLVVSYLDSGRKIIDEVVNANPQNLGDLSGFYFLNSTSSTPQEIALDDFILTKEETVSDEPCVAPTYQITRPDGKKKRYFTLSCADAGAKIYYSETQIEAGAEGWIEYTGETLTDKETIYAYAYNASRDATSEVISFSTGAGTSVKLNSPEINLVSYDAEQGYGFKVSQKSLGNFSGGLVPSEYSFLYAVLDADEAVYSSSLVNPIAEGETKYAEEGRKIAAKTHAEGFEDSKEKTFPTQKRPTGVRKIWGIDFASLVNKDVYGTDRKSIVTSGDVTFTGDYGKSFHGLTQFVSGGSTVAIDADSRAGLTTTENFYLSAEEGLVGTGAKTEPLVDEETGESTEEMEEFLARTNGLGISGLQSGQYVYVVTSGDKPEVHYGADVQTNMCVEGEYIYRATGETMYIELVDGLAIKSVNVYDDKESVTTNAYGYAVYTCNNAVQFGNGLEAYVVDKEVTAGNFTRKKYDEVPAGTTVILKGQANTTYDLTFGAASILDVNLLTVSSEDIKVNEQEHPVYTVSLETGECVKADANAIIPAGTAYIISAFEEIEYYTVTLGAGGKKALVYGKPLNFINVSGVEAHLAVSENVSDGSITLSSAKLDQVAAETPIVLVGTPGQTYQIEVGAYTGQAAYNMLKGSSSAATATASIENAIYRLNEGTGEFELIDKSVVSEIPAGEAFVRSNYIDFVELTTNAFGELTMTYDRPLSFSDVALDAHISNGEDNLGPQFVTRSDIPAGEPFYLKNGEANTTYRVPVTTGGISLGVENRLRSSNIDFAVIDTVKFVYIYDSETGKWVHAPEEYVVPAGETYFISEQDRKADLGTETVTIGAGGRSTHICYQPLDFTNSVVKAYIVTGEMLTNFTEERVNEVPAGKAIVIECEPGTYEIPVGTLADWPSGTVNLMKGSNEEGFDVSTTTKAVYGISKSTGKYSRAKADTHIPAGVGYVISEYEGFKNITTNEYGFTTYVTDAPLDFSGIEGVTVEIVTSENFREVKTVTVTQVPGNNGKYGDYAFIFKGEPNKTYSVPVKNDITGNGRGNILCGSVTEDFDISSYEDGNVYGYLANGTVAKGRGIVPAGRAYLKSKYFNSMRVKTNSQGIGAAVAENPIYMEDIRDTTSIELYIVYDAEEDGTPISDVKLSYVPRGEAFYFVGKPNKEYLLPCCYTPDFRYMFQDGGIVENLLHVSTSDFTSSDIGKDVYTVTDRSNKLVKTALDEVIPAGQPYFTPDYWAFEPIKLNEYGMTTYITRHALDFSGLAVTDTVRIVVDETETEFKTADVKEVPAGTPIIFFGTPDKTYLVPVGDCTEETWAYTGRNLLRGSNDATFYVSSVAPKLVYGVTKKGKFARASSTTSFAPGKAYIISKYSSGASAKGMSVSGLDEDIEATAISEISAESENTEKIFFNLAGQPVGDDYKGIVIDKEGKKYNRK